MHVLVTGGAGFIGSHLVDALLARGDTVRVLDNFSTGSWDNLVGKSAEIIPGDITDWDTIRVAVEGCDLVYHEAALVSVPLSMEDPATNHLTNVDGTFHVFEAARQAGIKRVVYATSCAVYGNLPSVPKKESDPVAPVSPYAASKLIAEQYADTYNTAYDMEIIGLRYMNVFGPRQSPGSPYSGVLSIFCNAAMAGKGIMIFGDGGQTRDFVSVHDIVAANLLAGSTAFDPAQTVFNVGQGQETDLNEIVGVLEGIIGRKIPVTYKPERAGDIRHSYADITLIQDHLNYSPQVTVEAGLRETLDWFQ